MRWVVLLMLLFGSLPAAAVPPPPVLATADCDAPSYASDQLVCGDAELLALDRLLAARIAERDGADDGYSDGDADLEWFQRSRRCAFEADHRECLLAAYCLRLVLVGSFGPDVVALCNPATGNYLPASALSQSGFVRPGAGTENLQGREIRIWGFVDHGNLYGDAAAREILGEWCSGEGPAPGSWRFNLKAVADDPVGASFAVHIPDGPLRDDLLRVFVADARGGRATRVYLEGKLELFDAPTQGARLTGLRLELGSSRAIRLGRPGSE
jgi:hypothetical protein